MYCILVIATEQVLWDDVWCCTQVPKLQEQQAELLERNSLLEQLREDLSARLAKQQDALNDLRAAGDKLVALAGATAAECAAAQQTSHDAQLAALEHISEVCVTARISSRFYCA